MLAKLMRLATPLILPSALCSSNAGRLVVVALGEVKGEKEREREPESGREIFSIVPTARSRPG